MVGQGTSLNLDISEFSARLLVDQEVHARARTCARAIAELIPGTAVSVYVAGRLDGNEVWLAKASVGEVSPHSAAVPMDSGTLGELAASVAGYAVLTCLASKCRQGMRQYRTT